MAKLETEQGYLRTAAGCPASWADHDELCHDQDADTNPFPASPRLLYGLYPSEPLLYFANTQSMIPLDKKRLNVTLVPALIAQLDRMARYWGVHRSTIISAAINAGLLSLQDMRDKTQASPDKGKAKLKDLAATQLELPLCSPLSITTRERSPHA